mgnify:CR=1 FL=1|jgi:hypothetical protein|tara:strand:+ start:131 stop:385 length:255 start_codon:yes stop_codon:yes gene_type:complete
MASYKKSSPTENINLIYIRAAIEANTGVRLSLVDVRRYLVEEGLITKAQARKHATVFKGYQDYYSADEFSIKALPNAYVSKDEL